MHKKIENLLVFLINNNLKKEAKEIVRVAAPLPEGIESHPDYPISEMSGTFNLGGYEEGISQRDLSSNINLKKFFRENNDPGFISKFKFFHFYQSEGMDVDNFVYKYSQSQNPREMSVVGTDKDPCSISWDLPFPREYVLELSGEPVSAFYFDASSSLRSSVSQESLIKKLEDMGLTIRDDNGNIVYFPKLTSLNSGAISSFFYDAHSYEEASGGRESSYHEFFIKNSKVIRIWVKGNYNPEKIYKDFFYNDEIYPEIKHLIKCCNGMSADDLENDVLSKVKNFITRNYNNDIAINIEGFEQAYSAELSNYLNSSEFSKRLVVSKRLDDLEDRLVEGYKENAGELSPKDFEAVYSALSFNSENPFDTRRQEISDAFFEPHNPWYEKYDNLDKITRIAQDLTEDVFNIFDDKFYWIWRSKTYRRVSDTDEKMYYPIFEKYFNLLNMYCKKFSEQMIKLIDKSDPEELSETVVYFIAAVDTILDDSMGFLFEKKLNTSKIFSDFFEVKKEELRGNFQKYIFDEINKNIKLKEKVNDELYERAYSDNEHFVENYLSQKERGANVAPLEFRPILRVFNYSHDMPTIEDYSKT